MKKNSFGFLLSVIISLVLVIQLNAQPQQAKVKNIASLGDQVVDVKKLAPEKIDAGYLFWHQADELATDVINYAMLLNNEGELVHRWDTDLNGGGHTSYLLESGGLLRTGVRDRGYVKGQPVAATDILQITDKKGHAIWEISSRELSKKGSKVTFHHDMLPMPNGNILALIYEEISAEKAEAAGWTAGKGKTVWSDGVMEISPDLKDGSFKVVWQWRFVDHIIQDLDKSASHYGAVAEHPERIDCNFPKSYAPMNSVRQHLNAIDYNPALDQILVSSFIYNEIWILDHSTTPEEARGSTGGRRGKGGDLLFRYGNPAAYGAGTEKDRLFLKQHDANWVDTGLPGAGNILVMNNNTQLNPGAMMSFNSGGGAAAALAQEQLKGVSNVHEICPVMDQQGKYAYKKDKGFSAKKIWFWENPNFFAPFQGGARRLPNGNTLLSNTVRRTVMEVSPRGDIVAVFTGPAPTFKSFKFTNEQVAVLFKNK